MPGQLPCSLNLHRWLANRPVLLCREGSSCELPQHPVTRPSLSSTDYDTWSRTAPPPAARLVSSSSNKDLNLQRSQQSNLQTGHFEKVSLLLVLYHSSCAGNRCASCQSSKSEWIKKLRFILRGAAAAQSMSWGLELPENSLLRFPDFLQIDLVQSL